MVDLPIQFFCSTASRFQGVKRLYLFGSRAKASHTETSDFDLAADWEEVPGENWGSFVDALKEGKPFLQQVDLVRLDKIGPELLARIHREGKVIYEQGKANLPKP